MSGSKACKQVHFFWAPAVQMTAGALRPHFRSPVESCVENYESCAVRRACKSLYIGRAVSTSGCAGQRNQKSRIKRGEEGKECRGKGKQATAEQQGEEGEGEGWGDSSSAQPEPSEQRNREGREGDGRCRLAVAKGGGRVPRDGALTAPARGKSGLSIHAYIHTYTHTYINTYIHTYKHTYICT